MPKIASGDYRSLFGICVLVGPHVKQSRRFFVIRLHENKGESTVGRLGSYKKRLYCDECDGEA